MFIAERFSASRAGRRERSGNIAKSQAVFDHQRREYIDV
jgi:hypothetical protein